MGLDRALQRISASSASLTQPGGIQLPFQKTRSKAGKGGLALHPESSCGMFKLKKKNPAALSHELSPPLRASSLAEGRPTASTRARVEPRVNHRSAVHRGDDSFTAPELPATRSRRTMTAAHAASLILNKCFKVQTPAARDAESQARWRGASVPG